MNHRTSLYYYSQFTSLLDILATYNPPRMGGEAIGVLYNTFPHPPAAFLSQEYAFRAPDGAGNNLQDVNLGRAGRPYARSVTEQHSTSLTKMPDPGLIFDTLLKRREVCSPITSEIN